MDGYGLLILLYAAGVILLLAEVVIPSHGLLTVAAIIALTTAVVRTFDANPTAGWVAAAACVLLLPTVLILGLKNIHRLPVGRYVAPPNPRAPTDEELYPAEELRALVGRAGRAVTPLRPVGTCVFGGRRITCVAETGVIDAGTRVEGCGLSGKELIVRSLPAEEQTA